MPADRETPARASLGAVVETKVGRDRECRAKQVVPPPRAVVAVLARPAGERPPPRRGQYLHDDDRVGALELTVHGRIGSHEHAPRHRIEVERIESCAGRALGRAMIEVKAITEAHRAALRNGDPPGVAAMQHIEAAAVVVRRSESGDVRARRAGRRRPRQQQQSGLRRQPGLDTQMEVG